MNNKRIIGLDFARGVAILGMIVVNFKTVLAFGSNEPKWLAGLTGLLEGRAAAAFVVLAGMGLSLLSQQARESMDTIALKKSRKVLLQRSLFLFIGGLALCTVWPADILHYYGVYIAIGALMLGTTSIRLILWAIGFVLFFPVLLVLAPYEAGWDFNTLTYMGFWTFEGFFRNLFYNGFHPVFPWTGFLIFGMWLGRLDLRNPDLRSRIFWVSLATAMVTELFSMGMMALIGESELKDLFGTAIMPPMPGYLLAGSATATAVICLCIAFCERYPQGLFTRILIPTGQLALTHYVLHVFVGFGVLEELGLLNDQSLTFAVVCAVIYSCFTLIFSVLWLKRFSRGPFEMMMRKITS